MISDKPGTRPLVGNSSMKRQVPQSNNDTDPADKLSDIRKGLEVQAISPAALYIGIKS